MKISIILLVISFCNTSATSQIYFKGEIHSIKKNEIVKKISLSMPIGSFPQTYYSDNANDLYPDDNGKISQAIKFTTPNLIFLKLANGQLFLAIAEPGDTINFHVLIDSAGSAKMKFLGKDSLAYEYLNHLNHTILKKLINLKNKELDPRALLNGVDSIVNGEETIIGNSTKSKFKSNLLDNMIEARVLYNMINFYGHTTDTSVKKNEDDHICQELYKKFDPLQEKYLPTWTGPMNVEALGDAVEEKRYQFRQDAFQKVDSEWVAIDEGYTIPSTFPEPFREDQIGNYILIGAIRLKFPNTQRAMLYFAKQYPGSPFIPIFQKILSIDTSGVLSKKIVQNAKDSATDSEIKFVKNPETLNGILTKYAKDKPVLIDCWATWCVYCMIEFPYLPQHESFFKQNHIVKLYISYDVPSFTSTWQNVVQSEKLEGINVLANKSIQKELLQLINLPVKSNLPLPHYVLLNSKHQVVNSDMLRPSNILFEQQILKDLFKKLSP